MTVTNQDPSRHDWTSRDGVWASPALAQGQSYSFTFNQAGSYPYLCSIHPSMTGTITVQ